jgi:hypothetical protein
MMSFLFSSNNNKSSSSSTTCLDGSLQTRIVAAASEEEQRRKTVWPIWIPLQGMARFACSPLILWKGMQARAMAWSPPWLLPTTSCWSAPSKAGWFTLTLQEPIPMVQIFFFPLSDNRFDFPTEFTKLGRKNWSLPCITLPFHVRKNKEVILSSIIA